MECLAKEAGESVSIQFDPLIDAKGCGKCSCSEKVNEPISSLSLPHEVNSVKTTEIDQRQESKRLHQFYFLKIRPSSKELNQRAADIEEMERSINVKKTALAKRLHERKSDKDRLSSKLKYESQWSGYDQDYIAWTRIEIELREQTLHELCFPNKPRPQRTARFLCSPDQYQEDQIFGVHFTSQVSLQLCRNRYQDRMAWNKIDLKYLQQAREFYSSKKPTWTMTIDCVNSAEEELNGMIESLRYRIRHGNNSLVEERKFLKEIKLAEPVRGKHTRIRDKDGRSNLEAKRNEIKCISERLNIQMKLLMQRKENAMQLKEKIEAAENDIRSLQKELDDINDIRSQENPIKSKCYRRKNKVHKFLFEIQKQNETLQNSRDLQYLSVFSYAKELAKEKNVAALKELSHTQVEEYMSQWNKSKDFRDDYIEKISISVGRSY